MPRLWDRTGKVIKDYEYLVAIGLPYKGRYGWTIRVYHRKYVDSLPCEAWLAAYGTKQTKKEARKDTQRWLDIANREARAYSRSHGQSLADTIVYAIID